MKIALFIIQMLVVSVCGAGLIISIIEACILEEDRYEREAMAIVWAIALLGWILVFIYNLK